MKNHAKILMTVIAASFILTGCKAAAEPAPVTGNQETEENAAGSEDVNAGKPGKDDK